MSPEYLNRSGSILPPSSAQQPAQKPKIAIAISGWRLQSQSQHHGFAEEDKRIMTAVARHVLGLVEGAGTSNVVSPR